MGVVWRKPIGQSVIVFSALALLPLAIESNFGLSIATFILIYAIVALSWNLLVGYSGQISFGHNGFFLIGAYTSAVLVKTVGLPFIAGLGAAGAFAAITGAVVGFPAVRLKGFYLAMVTIAFAESLDILAKYLEPITGGVYGFAGIPKASVGGYVFSSPSSFYYLVLVVCFLLFVVVQNLLDSRVGQALRAMCSDETVATAMGININITKLQIFALSACLTGFAGSLYAHFVRFLAPDVFTIKFQVNLFFMCIIGGSISVWGALIGAAIITVLPQVITGLGDWYYVIWAVIVILVLAFMPKGIYSLLHFVTDPITRRRQGVSRESERGAA